jgi:carbamoyl-phosphate synthase large subunit
VDVDALADGTDVLIAHHGAHEEAGVHSGDSSCVLPPQSLSDETLRTIEDYTVRLAKALRVIGLMNVQYAIQNGVVYVLEVNPRASRTVPYVSKATGVALPNIAVGLMWGRKLKDYGFTSGKLSVPQDFVKSPVFPFNKFHGVDPVLGPEMRSTGEVMGVGINFGEAFLKAQTSAGVRCRRRVRSSSASTTITRRKPWRWPGGSPNSASRWRLRAARQRRCAMPGWFAGLFSKLMKAVPTR